MTEEGNGLGRGDVDAFGALHYRRVAVVGAGKEYRNVAATAAAAAAAAAMAACPFVVGVAVAVAGAGAGGTAAAANNSGSGGLDRCFQGRTSCDRNSVPSFSSSSSCCCCSCYYCCCCGLAADE